jgi:opacity protein-like surface antigen
MAQDVSAQDTAGQPPIWAGAYVGAGASHRWSSSTATMTGSTENRSSSTGTRFHGLAGYNWRFSPWVLGLEGEVSRSDHSRPGISGAGFVRAGYATGPWLFFVRAGADVTRPRTTWRNTTTGEVVVQEQDSAGPSFGAGVERALTGHIVLRSDLTVTGHSYRFQNPFSSGQLDASSSATVLRGSLIYTFH